MNEDCAMEVMVLFVKLYAIILSMPVSPVNKHANWARLSLAFQHADHGMTKTHVFHRVKIMTKLVIMDVKI